MPDEIERQDLHVRRERPHLIVPVGTVAQPAMDEDYGRGALSEAIVS